MVTMWAALDWKNKPVNDITRKYILVLPAYQKYYTGPILSLPHKVIAPLGNQRIVVSGQNENNVFIRPWYTRVRMLYARPEKWSTTKKECKLFFAKKIVQWESGERRHRSIVEGSQFLRLQCSTITQHCGAINMESPRELYIEWKDVLDIFIEKVPYQLSSLPPCFLPAASFILFTPF